MQKLNIPVVCLTFLAIVMAVGSVEQSHEIRRLEARVDVIAEFQSRQAAELDSVAKIIVDHTTILKSIRELFEKVLLSVSRPPYRTIDLTEVPDHHIPPQIIPAPEKP